MKSAFINCLAGLTIILTSTSKTVAQEGSPLQLTSFTAECTSGAALIDWSTSVQTNVDYFTLDRTNDGVTYETVATIKGAGSSDGSLNYSVTDSNLLSGTYYYRLSETGLDGTTTRFNMIAFEPCSVDNSITACFEREHINIQVQSNSANTYSIMIVNMQGVPLVNQSAAIARGINNISLSPALTDGLYVINVHNSDSTINYSRKLLIGMHSF
jgi:hypothetical protein